MLFKPIQLQARLTRKYVLIDDLCLLIMKEPHAFWLSIQNIKIQVVISSEA